MAEASTSRLVIPVSLRFLAGGMAFVIMFALTTACFCLYKLDSWIFETRSPDYVLRVSHELATFAPPLGNRYNAVSALELGSDFKLATYVIGAPPQSGKTSQNLDLLHQPVIIAMAKPSRKDERDKDLIRSLASVSEVASFGVMRFDKIVEWGQQRLPAGQATLAYCPVFTAQDKTGQPTHLVACLGCISDEKRSFSFVGIAPREQGAEHGSKFEDLFIYLQRLQSF